MMMTRRPGWESRLAAVLADAQHAPYILGQHDCLRVACRTVDALTGIDLWPRFAGYTTKRQALVTIARIAPGLGEAVTATLGRTPSSVVMARRGDLALYRDSTGEDHLGVCTGHRVAVLMPEGLHHLSLRDEGLLGAWRIG